MLAIFQRFTRDSPRQRHFTRIIYIHVLVVGRTRSEGYTVQRAASAGIGYPLRIHIIGNI